ncbi:MAG: hypothetical protein IKI50_06780 [Clostridia bacterium]|nr:hypothetical protein [Clostridia bacterium]
MDYMDGINTKRRETSPYLSFDTGVWGIKVYDLLEEFFELEDAGRAYIGWNNVCTLQEHKTHILNQCRIFSSKGLIQYSNEIDKQIQQICDLSDLCVMLKVKMDIKNGQRIEQEKRSFRNNIRELRNREYETYSKLIKLNGWQ